MDISKTSQQVYEGIAKILKENGQQFSKAQAYAVENLVQTVEEATEKRCCEMTEKILAKKDKLVEQQMENTVSEATIEKVNALVEDRVEELKKELPTILDYAKLKKLSECVEAIKECVGYKTDEQVARVATESAKMLNNTKNLIEAQTKTISEKSASLVKSATEVKKLNEKINQMQKTIEAKDKQILESASKSKQLESNIQVLQKKVDESKKINESLEQKRKSESLRLYLEEKIQSYPKYEASLLRKHFANAKSRAEIDENFNKVLSMVQGKRDTMSRVQAIPVTKVINESEKKISGGETIVKEDGGRKLEAGRELYDESFVSIDDDDVISNDDMQRWISNL